MILYFSVQVSSQYISSNFIWLWLQFIQITHIKENKLVSRNYYLLLAIMWITYKSMGQ